MSKCPAYCPPTCQFTINYCDYPIYCDDYDCTNPETCVRMIPSDCVVYEGTLLQQYGVQNGATATEIITQLVNLLYPNCTTTTLVPTTTTTTLAIVCECYQANNLYGCEFEYTQCDGTVVPFAGETGDIICAQVGSITNIVGCFAPIGHGFFTPLGTSCTNDGDCILPTTTTTIAADATKCADCFPVLDNVTQNAIGKLSVGNLISTADIPCVVGDYVIDWYLDSITNPIEFTSGVGSDPAIDQVHPFTGIAARPSVAGNWIPVIRYVYLDGTKYTSANVPGEQYSPDLATCLEPITVENLNCSNGNSPLADYSHSLSYQTVIQNPSDATRILNFDLDSVTNFFAWQFNGFSVSDKIQFYYVSGATDTSLGEYAIGIDVTATDFTGSVKEIKEEYFKDVFDLSGFTFVSGDYIRIEITASYANPSNTNTNWQFFCKCLETFDCTVPPPAVVDSCSSVMTYDSLACTYSLTYNYSSYPNRIITDTAKYLTFQLNSGGSLLGHYPSFDEPYTTFNFLNGEFCNYGVYNPGPCANASLKTLTKVGSVYTFDFTDQTEYLFWKNEYTTIYNNLNLTYSSDTSNVNHFKFLYFHYLYDPALSGCGDNILRKDLMFHLTSPITFDDVNYVIQIDVTNTTNTMPARCNNSCSNLSAMSQVNTTITLPDFGPLSSTVRSSYQGYFVYTVNTNTNLTSFFTYINSHFLPYTFANYICNQEPNPCIETQSLYTKLLSHDLYEIVTITDSLDPINNYKIENAIDANGCELITPVTIFEISGGIIITPSGGCP